MSEVNVRPVDPDIAEICSRFFDGTPVCAETIDTGRGDSDFRNTIIITSEGGEDRGKEARSFPLPLRLLPF